MIIKPTLMTTKKGEAVLNSDRCQIVCIRHFPDNHPNFHMKELLKGLPRCGQEFIDEGSIKKTSFKVKSLEKVETFDWPKSSDLQSIVLHRFISYDFSFIISYANKMKVKRYGPVEKSKYLKTSYDQFKAYLHIDYYKTTRHGETHIVAFPKLNLPGQ